MSEGKIENVLEKARDIPRGERESGKSGRRTMARHNRASKSPQPTSRISSCSLGKPSSYCLIPLCKAKDPEDVQDDREIKTFLPSASSWRGRRGSCSLEYVCHPWKGEVHKDAGVLRVLQGRPHAPHAWLEGYQQSHCSSLWPGSPECPVSPLAEI